MFNPHFRALKKQPPKTTWSDDELLLEQLETRARTTHTIEELLEFVLVFCRCAMPASTVTGNRCHVAV
jgi:hypothetical protein